MPFSLNNLAAIPWQGLDTRPYTPGMFGGGPILPLQYNQPSYASAPGGGGGAVAQTGHYVTPGYHMEGAAEVPNAPGGGGGLQPLGVGTWYFGNSLGPAPAAPGVAPVAPTPGVAPTAPAWGAAPTASALGAAPGAFQAAAAPTAPTLGAAPSAPQYTSAPTPETRAAFTPPPASPTAAVNPLSQAIQRPVNQGMGSLYSGDLTSPTWNPRRYGVTGQGP